MCCSIEFDASLILMSHASVVSWIIFIFCGASATTGKHSKLSDWNCSKKCRNGLILHYVFEFAGGLQPQRCSPPHTHTTAGVLSRCLQAKSSLPTSFWFGPLITSGMHRNIKEKLWKWLSFGPRAYISVFPLALYEIKLRNHLSNWDEDFGVWCQEGNNYVIGFKDS